MTFLKEITNFPHIWRLYFMAPMSLLTQTILRFFLSQRIQNIIWHLKPRIVNQLAHHYAILGRLWFMPLPKSFLPLPNSLLPLPNRPRQGQSCIRPYSKILFQHCLNHSLWFSATAYSFLVIASVLDGLFLDAFSHLYKRVCPFVRRSVSLSVRR